VQAIRGDQLASPLLDQYLAETGVEGQASGEPIEPDRRDNLFEPVPGDPGAHGRFDDMAVATSWQMWLNRHRAAIGASAAGGLATAGLAWMLGRRRR
jgi:hypothetical protein